MSVATHLATGFPDLAGMPVVRRLHWGRWLSAASILLVLALIGRAFYQGQIEWAYVGRFLTVPVILDGIRNTVVSGGAGDGAGDRAGRGSGGDAAVAQSGAGGGRPATPGCSAARR